MVTSVARTLDPARHALRREAILDVAEQLIRTKGYERMSIQDVQDVLGVSRGAIYHYFTSKSALLEAVIERAADAVICVMRPIAEDPDLPAVAKLQAVFDAGRRWKTERRDLMLALVRAWYSDDNAVVREHATRITAAGLTPLVAGIVRQGVAEGAMHVSSPDRAADVLMDILVASSDRTGRLFLESLAGRVPFEDVAATVAAYDEAVERILGLPTGSFELIDEPILRSWFA
jgi:AcrR family transcriptional regulator